MVRRGPARYVAVADCAICCRCVQEKEAIGISVAVGGVLIAGVAIGMWLRRQARTGNLENSELLPLTKQ